MKRHALFPRLDYLKDLNNMGQPDRATALV
jgi:hypothetical protein